MKRFAKNKQVKRPTDSLDPQAASVLKNNGSDSDQLILKRIGKSRREILDLMKILKTF